MSTIEIETRASLSSYQCNSHRWEVFGEDETVYQCEVILGPLEDGLFPVYAARLPGVVSQGETIQEALVNIVEALRGVIDSYKADSEAIPWLSTPRTPSPREERRWVLVHG